MNNVANYIHVTLSPESCRDICSEACSAPTTFQLKIKEARMGATFTQQLTLSSNILI